MAYRIGQTRALVRHMATAVDAYKRCIKTGNKEWEGHWAAAIKDMADLLPHGSGIDGENLIDVDASTSNKLVIDTGFHHMDEHGGYDGWTEHRLIARPSFIHGVEITISGPNRNEIKDYLHELFADALQEFYVEAAGEDGRLVYLTASQASIAAKDFATAIRATCTS